MSRLDKAYIYLTDLETKESSSGLYIDVRFAILVTLFYLIVMLSVSVENLGMLIWFGIFPIINAAVLGIGFGGVFIRSLIILPLVILIGIFNPYYDHRVAFEIGGVIVNMGWITFVSVVLRGLFGLQVALILVEGFSFRGVCRGFRALGVPAFLTDQMQFVYRYINVLITEAISMKRAREARGYGRKSYPVKLWGVMIGQLLLRTIERSERIGLAMAARGFRGKLPEYKGSRRKKSMADWLYLFGWTLLFILLRIFNLSALFEV